LSRSEVKVQVSLKEIYARVCPKCRRKIRELIKEKITDRMVDQVLEGEG